MLWFAWKETLGEVVFVWWSYITTLIQMYSKTGHQKAVTILEQRTFKAYRRYRLNLAVARTVAAIHDKMLACIL